MALTPCLLLKRGLFAMRADRHKGCIRIQRLIRNGRSTGGHRPKGQTAVLSETAHSTELIHQANTKRRPIHGAVFPPRSAYRQERIFLAEVATLCSRCHRPVYLFLASLSLTRDGLNLQPSACRPARGAAHQLSS
jgi:hypothetical protein